MELKDNFLFKWMKFKGFKINFEEYKKIYIVLLRYLYLIMLNIF